MRYVSTRGGRFGDRASLSFSEIVLEGLAPDGGLAVPTCYPRFDSSMLASLRDLDYRGLAFEILSRFIGDIPQDDLRDIIDRTYTAAVFGTEEITPVRTLDTGLHILGLSNGPTMAFKDIAMQFLGNLFEYVLGKTGGELNILGATSGDTGSSAEYAMRGKDRIRVFMLSPYGRMSPVQTAQMYSLQDPNIHNLAVTGVFDDCQDIVKAVAADAEFKRRYHIGTVNSINWARVLAQVVYYFKGYFAVTTRHDQQVSFSVPSGNFGNVLAGHVARQMGLPIKNLIVATNENDVLDEFFRTGRYRVRKAEETRQTSSPSMDISKASNFERFIFDAVDRDPETLSLLWNLVERDGGFDLGASQPWLQLSRFGFLSGRSTHADRVNTIRALREGYNELIDPHTSDGVYVGMQFREPSVPMVCLETALPAKFQDVLTEALGHPPDIPHSVRELEALPQRFEVVPASAEKVKNYIESHVA